MRFVSNLLVLLKIQVSLDNGHLPPLWENKVKKYTKLKTEKIKGTIRTYF